MRKVVRILFVFPCWIVDSGMEYKWVGVFRQGTVGTVSYRT